MSLLGSIDSNPLFYWDSIPLWNNKKVFPVAGVKVVPTQQEHLPPAEDWLIYISVILFMQVVMMDRG